MQPRWTWTVGVLEGLNQPPGLDGKARGDDIDLLLADIEWEESLVADVTMKSAGKKTPHKEEERNDDPIPGPTEGELN